MSGPDTRDPGQLQPDFRATISKELNPADYYVGLSVLDANRVLSFINLVRSAGESTNWGFAVMAYGSTTRLHDRAQAHDIDLKILTTVEGEDRIDAIRHIRARIREYCEKLGVPFREYDHTFKWDSVHPYENFADRLHNGDPSFVINDNSQKPGLPLHVSIAGDFNLPARDKIEHDRQAGNKSFAVLLEP